MKTHEDHLLLILCNNCHIFQMIGDNTLLRYYTWCCFTLHIFLKTDCFLLELQIVQRQTRDILDVLFSYSRYILDNITLTLSSRLFSH